MPSPIAHTAVGLTLAILGRGKLPEPHTIGPLPAATAVFITCSLLPDVDSAVGLAAGDFGRYHNNLTHSFFMATAVSFVVSSLIGWRYRVARRPWFVAAFLAYALHILMDATNVGRGVMAFWPLTLERVRLPVLLFYGFHWSDGLLSKRHLWTLVTELLFAAVALGLAWQVKQARQRAQG
jgi:membrane-bound metal-dependent hydrolase YbcI (DUF457 family)